MQTCILRSLQDKALIRGGGREESVMLPLFRSRSGQLSLVPEIFIQDVWMLGDRPDNVDLCSRSATYRQFYLQRVWLRHVCLVGGSCFPYVGIRLVIAVLQRHIWADSFTQKCFTSPHIHCVFPLSAVELSFREVVIYVCWLSSLVSEISFLFYLYCAFRCGLHATSRCLLPC